MNVASRETIVPVERVPKDIVGIGMLQLFPPTIRASVLEDESFRREFRLTTDADIALEPSGTSFRRSKLFDAIRNLLGGVAPNVEVKSNDGVRWELDYRESDESIVLTREGVEIILPDFMCLSADRAKRVGWFARQADKFELDDECAKMWHEKLETGIVEDEEVDSLLSEFRLTPIWMTQFIAKQLRENRFGITSLVPSDIRYYDRLIGKLKGEINLEGFVAAAAAPRIHDVIRRHPFEGIKHALLLSSHSSLVQAIELKDVPSGDVVRVYNWLQQNGDRLSQLGAIECGFAHLEVFPQLEAVLIKLIQGFLADDPRKFPVAFRSYPV